MLKKSLNILWLLLLSVGVIFPNFYGSLFDTLTLGTASFPTSVATLTNPASTDSVATVSHSSQHANANDEIEAIETKIGTGASTPTTNSIFYSSGTGVSAWSATPSLTSLTLSGQGWFGSLISNASSTINGSLNILGNATSTNATSTIGAFTSFATTTKLWGAGLATCQSGNFLTWLSGAFGCASDQTGSAGVMTSQLAAASQVSTSTTITSGRKYFFATSFNTGDSAALGLYIYQDGTKNATTTLQGSVQCDMAGVASEKCPITLMGTFTATTTETVHIFAGTDSNTIYTVPASYNANFIVIEF